MDTRSFQEQATTEHAQSTEQTRLHTDIASIAKDIVKELREHPERWTQQAIARTAAALELDDANDVDAVCWCLEGHIEKRTSSTSSWEVYEAFRDALGTRGLFRWNDSKLRTVDDVIALCETVANRTDENGVKP
jgi:hypothetical protein